MLGIGNIYYSVHATALATFAETIGGLAIMSTLGTKDRAILTSLKMEVCTIIIIIIMNYKISFFSGEGGGEGVVIYFIYV